MRLIYMGTPQFAVAPLRALAAAGHEIAGVVTRTDKPAGRGRTLAAPPVKLVAQELGLIVHQPKRVRDPEFIELLRKIGPDAIVVAAYGQILPREVLVLPKHGCINIHASVLPAYRGAAPINWAIIRGEQETGNTIMLMDEGMDTGAILMQERLPIGREDTAGSMTEKLSLLGARLITEALPLIASNRLSPIVQDSSKATTAPLLKKGTASLTGVSRRMRSITASGAFPPGPAPTAFLRGRRSRSSGPTWPPKAENRDCCTKRAGTPWRRARGAAGSAF